MCWRSTCNSWKLCINYNKLIKCCNKSFNSYLKHSVDFVFVFCFFPPLSCICFIWMIFCFVNSAIFWRILENSTLHLVTALPKLLEILLQLLICWCVSVGKLCYSLEKWISSLWSWRSLILMAAWFSHSSKYSKEEEKKSQQRVWIQKVALLINQTYVNNNADKICKVLALRFIN